MIATFITSSMLIISVMVIRKLFRKRISCRIQYALWLLVAVRLLLTPALPISSNLSIMNYVGTPEYSVENDNTSVPDNFIIADQNSNEEISQNKIQNTSINNTDSVAITNNQNKSSVNIKNVIALVWMSGTALIIVYTLIYNLKVYSIFRKRRMIYDGYDCSRKIYLIEGIKSPCLFLGSIYIMPEITADDDKMKHSVTHELMHLRHLDEMWSVIRVLCIAMYWLNPLVWVAAYFSKRDCELACDESVIKNLGETERLNYGRTLINLALKNNSISNVFAFNTSMYGNKKEIKERVIAVSEKKKFIVPVLLTVLIIAGILTATLLTVKNKDDTQKADGNDSTIATTGDLTLEELIYYSNCSYIEPDAFDNYNNMIVEDNKKIFNIDIGDGISEGLVGHVYQITISSNNGDIENIQIDKFYRDCLSDSCYIYSVVGEKVIDDAEYFFNNDKDISDYFSYELPENLNISTPLFAGRCYFSYDDVFGGVDCPGFAEIIDYSNITLDDEDKIVTVKDCGSVLEYVEGDGVSVAIFEYEYDEDWILYYAVFANVEREEAYAIALNEKYFKIDDIRNAAMSVKLKDDIKWNYSER